jgi:hypothetical protein
MSTHVTTPPNPNFDLPNHSMDLNKTLGIIGTPHEESIAMILSTKTCQIKKSRRNPTKNSSNPRTPKTPKSSPLTHGFGRRITSQRTTKGSHKFPPTNLQEQGLENTPRKPPREGPKITTKNNREQHNKALRNHAESSIQATKVHTRSSLPPHHPTLSQNFTMKLSS